MHEGVSHLACSGTMQYLSTVVAVRARLRLSLAPHTTESTDSEPTTLRVTECQHNTPSWLTLQRDATIICVHLHQRSKSPCNRNVGLCSISMSWRGEWRMKNVESCGMIWAESSISCPLYSEIQHLQAIMQNEANINATESLYCISWKWLPSWKTMQLQENGSACFPWLDLGSIEMPLNPSNYAIVSNANLHCPRIMPNIEHIESYWCTPFLWLNG